MTLASRLSTAVSLVIFFRICGTLSYTLILYAACKMETSMGLQDETKEINSWSLTFKNWGIP